MKRTKRFRGSRRHIAVYAQGLPHAIWWVTTAELTDRTSALALSDQHKYNLANLVNVLVDGGYTGVPFAKVVMDLLGAAAQVAKRSECHTLAVMPQRQVVERSFAWLKKCRRL